MAEPDVGMAGDVIFNPVPVIAVVADFFAVTADGKHALKRLDGGMCVGESADALGQSGLEGGKTDANLDARAKFGVVERFDDIMIGAGLEALDYLLLFGAGGEEDDVGGLQSRVRPGAPADFDAVEARHQPI